MRALRAAWSFGWRLVALLCAWGTLLAPFFVVLGPRLGLGASSAPPAIRLALEGWTALTLLVATWVLVRLVDRLPLASIGLGPKTLPRDAARGAGAGAGWLACTLLAAAAVGSLSFEPAGAFSWRALAVAGVAVAANAFTQELLFRGWPFQVLLRLAGPASAVVVTSVLFSAAHLPAFRGALLPAVNVALAGALFGLARLRSGALWSPVALHAAWNVLVGPVLGLELSGRTDLGASWRVLALHGPDLATGGAFGIEGSAATTLVTAAAIAIVAVRGRAAGAVSARAPGPADPPASA